MTENKAGTSRPALLLATTGVALFLVGALPLQAAPDCRARLNFDEAYECEFRSDQTDAEVDATVLFEEFDGNAFQATLDLLGETTVAYCTCKTAPKDRFDRSQQFECVSGFENSAAETFEGKVNGNGNRIRRGELWSSDPLGSGFARFAFDCGRGAGEIADGEDDDGQDEKVILCHKGRRTREVSSSAVASHLAHGDTLGPCLAE